MKLLHWLVGVFRRVKNVVLRCFERGFTDLRRARGQHPLRGYRQLTTYNCGATAAQSLIEYVTGSRARWSVLHRQLGVRPDGCAMPRMRRVLREYGLRTRMVRTCKAEILAALERGPVLASIKDEESGHWIVISGADQRHVHVVNDTSGIPGNTRRTWTWADFARRREFAGLVVS